MTDQILQANLSHYEDGTGVDAYLTQDSGHYDRALLALSLLKKGLAGKNNAKGIELAAGSGMMSEKIRDMGFTVTSCDAAEGALAKAAARGLPTMKFDVSQIFPLETASVDFIYAGELIEHLFNTRLFVSECYRVLKPGGVLVLTTPNLSRLEDRIDFLFGRNPRQVNPLHEYLYLHIRPFNASLLKHVLKDGGFKNTEIHSQSMDIDLFGKRFRCKGFARLFPGLGRSLISLSYK